MHRQVRKAMQQVFTDVFDSQDYILGRHVEAFERAWAARCGTMHAVGVSNGLDAIRLSLEVLGVGPGDEVIVPSNTYIATVLAVSAVGAQPVFAEPDIHTCNLDPHQIRAVRTARTKAVIPVHLYGQACVMDAIMAAAEGLDVVEDNAQAHGAAYAGRPTGGWGRVNATSFFPTKNLGALGDAGALTTSDTALAARAAVLRNYGSGRKYYNETIGYNMRLDELQAAFLSVKLDYLDAWTADRRRIAAQYTAGLDGLGDLRLPCTAPNADHVYHIYQIRTVFRDALQSHLSARGIGSLVHYPQPPYLQEAYKDLGYRRGDFPIAESVADTCLSLPIWPGMNETEVASVIGGIKDFYSKTPAS